MGVSLVDEGGVFEELDRVGSCGMGKEDPALKVSNAASGKLHGKMVVNWRDGGWRETFPTFSVRCRAVIRNFLTARDCNEDPYTFGIICGISSGMECTAVAAMLAIPNARISHSFQWRK